VGCIIIMNEGRHDWGGSQPVILLVLSVSGTDRGAYRRYLPPGQHVTGKRPIQRIERKHLTLRTRLKRLTRQTLCFSRSIAMHDVVIGLFINRYEFRSVSQ
jgi:IS1 family transposase